MITLVGGETHEVNDVVVDEILKDIPIGRIPAANFTICLLADKIVVRVRFVGGRYLRGGILRKGETIEKILEVKNEV